MISFVLKNFCREENCYWCLHVYLPVPDCCASGWEPSAEWGWRDDKVQLPLSRDSDIQLIGGILVLQSYWDGSLATWLKCLFSFLLFLSVTWWECSTGQYAWWNTASNLCMCLMANPHSSNQQRSVWALDLSCTFSHFLFQDEIMKKIIVNNICFCLFLSSAWEERREEGRSWEAVSKSPGNWYS